MTEATNNEYTKAENQNNKQQNCNNDRSTGKIKKAKQHNLKNACAYAFVQHEWWATWKRAIKLITNWVSNMKKASSSKKKKASSSPQLYWGIEVQPAVRLFPLSDNTFGQHMSFPTFGQQMSFLSLGPLLTISHFRITHPLGECHHRLPRQLGLLVHTRDHGEKK